MLSTLAVAQQQLPTPQPASPKPAPILEAPTPPGVTPISLPPETIVLTIGTEKITKAQFEELLAALAQGRPLPTGADKRRVATQLGELHAVAQEARKRKIDQNEVTKKLVALQTDQVLASELQKQVASEVKVDDAAAQTYYDSHKAQYEQVKALHILIRFKGSSVPLKPNEKDLTEAEALAKAEEIRKKLADGGDFAAIAKAESDDTGTAANGGALPPFSKGQMVKEFEDAVYNQPIGELSQPVKTKYGYHIIKVQERKEKTLEQARADIDKQLKQQMLREAMDRIEKETPVTLDEAYFGK
jgi:parvulin-like peptidyl-prolyl isomerase